MCVKCKTSSDIHSTLRKLNLSLHNNLPSLLSPHLSNSPHWKFTMLLHFIDILYKTNSCLINQSIKHSTETWLLSQNACQDLKFNLAAQPNDIKGGGGGDAQKKPSAN